MTKHAIAIAFGLTLSAVCLPQQTSWKAEPHDSLLVAPEAKGVEYMTYTGMDDDGGSEERADLHYVVKEPYPASKFIDRLQKDLQLKGWRPIPTLSEFSKPPDNPRGFYECGWTQQWRNSDNEFVLYMLRYKSGEDSTLGTLNVHAIFSAAHIPPKQSPSVSAKPVRSRLRERMYGLGFLCLYLLVLIALIRFLTFPKVRSAVFYDGAGAWLAWTNLVLIAPAFVFLLSIGGMVLAAMLPTDGNAARDGALVVAVLGWLFLAFCARAAYVAGPIVLVLTASILYAESIPKNVKIGHAVLGLLSLSFWVVCIAYFSGPLIRWSAGVENFKNLG
jgi:hypothetical protein